MRAITALAGYDSSKHSGIIAYFNLYYVMNYGFGLSTQLSKLKMDVLENPFLSVFYRRGRIRIPSRA
jgi:uncharacterized protein (UPF0332 family)